MENQNNGKAITSMVLGIIGVVVSVLFGAVGAIFGLVASIIALILGVKARKECPSGIATAGFILGIVGTVLSAVVFLACACLLGGLASLGEAAKSSY